MQVELTEEDGCNGTFLATPVARCGGRWSIAGGGGESVGGSDSVKRALPGASWVPPSHVRPLSLPLPSGDSPVRVGQTLLAERKNGDGGGGGGGGGGHGDDDDSGDARACELIDCEVLGFAGQGSERMYQVIFLHGDDCGQEDWIPARNLRGEPPIPLCLQDPQSGPDSPCLFSLPHATWLLPCQNRSTDGLGF